MKKKVLVLKLRTPVLIFKVSKPSGFFLLFILCVTQPVFAQQTITGKIVDEQNKTLPGVTVRELGNEKNVIGANNDGTFVIKVVSLQGLLSFTSIGYLTKTVKINGKTNLSVKLYPDVKTMTDVVVIGYQKVSKKTTTAAVSSVRTQDIENRPSPSFDQLMQGRVAGLSVQNYSGQPGSAPTFVVRGNSSVSRTVNAARALSSPLFVIDGVPLSNDDISSFADVTQTNFIAGINPNDIESIDVLKDAAAASIYGSRGANGVVIIQTKRGKSGKPQINLNYYAGVSTKAELEKYYSGAEERRYKVNYLEQLANPAQRKDFPMILTDSLNPAFNNADDWQDLFYRRGLIQNIDASAMGGSDNITYRLGTNYYNEEGIVKATGFKRYSITGNLGAKMSPKLNIDLSFRLSRGDRSRGRGVIPDPNEDYSNPLPINAGTFPSSFYKISAVDSLNYVGAYDQAKDKNINDDITTSIKVTYNILPKLIFASQGSLLSSTSTRDLFRPSDLSSDNYFYSYALRSTFQNYNLDNTLIYDLNVKKDHHINILAGNTINYIDKGASGLGGYGTGNNVITTVQNINPKYFDTYYSKSSSDQAGLLSFFSRVNYDYKTRYLLSFSYRADASSRFGKNNRWAYFPAVSAGWVISDEKFMESASNWLGMLKIRGSYGVSGNLPENFYAPYNSYLTSNGNFPANGDAITYNNVNPVTFNPSSITQNNLTWEKAIQSNIGIDADMFKGRLQFSVDAYNRGSSDKFFDVKLPVTSGYDKVFTNSVAIRNVGLDLTISGRVFGPESAFQWNPRLILSVNKNQIKTLPDNNRDIRVDVEGTSYILTRGRPVYEFYQVVSNGVYSNAADIPINPRNGSLITYWDGSQTAAPGTYRWADQNGDYDVWDYNDRVRSGDPNPRITGGFSNTFTYKNLSMEVFTSFLLGRDVYNSFIASMLNGYKQLGSFYTRGLLDLSKYNIWRQPGDQAKYADINPYGPYYYQFNTFSSAYMENGSYARIKYINIGYTFPKRWLEKLKISNFQLYSLIENVYTFQKSTLPDVEAVNAVGIYNGSGYPLPRKVTLGFRATF